MASVRSLRIATLTLVAVSILSGCASAPKGTAGSLISDDVALERTRDRPQSSRESKVDRPAIAGAKTLHISPPKLANGAGSSLSDRERQVLLGGVGRALCTRNSSYFELVPEGQAADIVLESEVTAVGLTNRGAAAFSLLGGALSPLPFTPRLPAGLGGLSVDLVGRAESGSEVLILRWAQGANAFTTDATPSKLGDAYALADVLGRDVRRLLREEPDGSRRDRVEPSVRRRNREQCIASFGRIDSGVRLARLALPLTPELIEPKGAGGAPDQ